MNPKIIPLSQKNFDAFFDLLSHEAKHLTGKALSNQVKKRLQKDAFSRPQKYQAFLACADNKVVGCLIVEWMYASFAARPRLFVEDIFVVKEFRRLGVAQSLLLHCLHFAKKNYCSSIDGCVLSWNKTSQKFVASIGGKKLNWGYYRHEIL